MKRKILRLLSLLLALIMILGAASVSVCAAEGGRGSDDHDDVNGPASEGPAGGWSSGSNGSTGGSSDNEGPPEFNRGGEKVETENNVTPGHDPTPGGSTGGDDMISGPAEEHETLEPKDKGGDNVTLVGGSDGGGTSGGGNNNSGGSSSSAPSSDSPDTSSPSASKPEASGGNPGASDDRDDARAGESASTAPKSTVENPAQGAVKKGPYVDWIERVELPRYAYDFYDALTAGSDESGLTRFLIEDRYFTIDPGADGGKTAKVIAAETLTIEEIPLFAGGGSAFSAAYFADEYNKVDVTKGDASIDFAALKEGDLVQNSTFNGVFVTKVACNEKISDAQRDEACAYISTSYQAFDRDHPEVFWLSGKSRVRMLTASLDNGTRETYFFFVLADKDGFTLRSDDYKAPGAVDAGIAQREAAVQTIMAAVNTAAGRQAQVKALNKWLTEHNAYNSSADLTKIGNNPHECLSALVGNIGTVGPVCDGYSRAFKVLCDRLAIPCVLADGYARSSADSAGESHMWNNVQMDDGVWYGVDVTWNDPVVVGQASVAISGHENENFLLVGKNTEIRGLTFAVSHPETDRVAVKGVSFANGLQLSPEAYYASSTALPFTDVPAGAYYYDAVAWAVGKGVTGGKTATTFVPGETCTQAQILTFLWRAKGQPEPAGTAGLAGADSSKYYYKAAQWAAEQDMIDGSFDPDAPCTRAMAMTYMWKQAGAPLAAGAPGAAAASFTDVSSDAAYAPAVAWAVSKGVTNGTTDTTFAPEQTCTRGQIVTFLYRAFQ